MYVSKSKENKMWVVIWFLLGYRDSQVPTPNDPPWRLGRWNQRMWYIIFVQPERLWQSSSSVITSSSTFLILISPRVSWSIRSVWTTTYQLGDTCRTAITQQTSGYGNRVCRWKIWKKVKSKLSTVCFIVEKRLSSSPINRSSPQYILPQVPWGSQVVQLLFHILYEGRYIRLWITVILR